MSCRVCRARKWIVLKVKCDERPGRCLNCERLDLTCVGHSHQSPTRDAPAGSTAKKKRTYRSCNSCRIAKSKCDGGRPTCFRCGVKSIQCTYDAGNMPFWAHVISKTPTERQARTHVRQGEEAEVTVAHEHEGEASCRHVVPRAVNDPTASFTPLDQSPGDPISFLFTPTLPTTPSILRRLAEQYFDNVHPLRCFAFVHKPSFMRRLDEGFGSDSNSALLHMICAHGARLQYFFTIFIFAWETMGKR
ncbi:hypothetical protein CEP52_013093 [Fusarium oligoseptatum]|uniref:Zn(2)-C6 fungal-type domain-containing protein n=1 Tax=Fusarium oligoseptatum TaxID=2604345 RepID=A0A428SVJ1_9HYPO|nr:hypothetical protein CEP52_013093 [Fusarium oligoseptatum]